MNIAYDARSSLWDHPHLPDWQYVVGNGDTLRGFADWLEYEQENV